MATHYSPKIVTDGLMLALDAANPKSYPGTGTTWYDMSGNGNDATLNGTAAYAVFNSAGYFDHTPTDAYFGAPDGSSNAPDANGAWWTIPHSAELAPTNEWTVCGFMNVQGDQSGNGGAWFHKASGDQRAIDIEPIASSIRTPHSTNWTSNQVSIVSYHNIWAHYTVTHFTSGVYGTDVGTTTLYVNSSVISTDSAAIPIIDTGTAIWLGRRNGHLKHFLDAQLANYQYYTRALSAAEVNQNFEATRSRFGI